ncbi:hypothetical protein [uncultured Anaerococcus sp.]|uniref:hypothetical protein n=1 Tax=uncultured Anaerococcus sp. TaxID=293428 RepID=UPI00288B1C5C|nr:hypothetical protein [uncultured Anaerococcus sp.]
MDIEIIINQIYNLILDNQFVGYAIVAFVVLLLFFIISKTFRKSGLFLLATTILIDYTIRSLPFDIYTYYPLAYKVIGGMYVAGFMNFLLRVLLMLIKLSRRKSLEENESSLKKFMNFTGIGPFFLMLIINLINFNNFIPKNIISLLTSLSFLFMAFRTLYSTYLYLSEKESLPISDNMNFDDIKAYLYTPDDESSKNKGRVLRRSLKKDEKNEGIIENHGDSKKKLTNPISISAINKSAKNMEMLKSFEKDLSDKDVIKLIEESNPNITKITLTNLKTGDEHSYMSSKANFHVEENHEYKITLSFDEYNDYDYGRFMDLLIAYGVDKEIYKFELTIISRFNQNFKLVFFDPSQIVDMDKDGNLSPSGKDISMNFPKYKINFIKGNY